MKGIVGQTLIYTAANIAARSAAMVALLIFPFLLTPTDYGALSMIVTITALAQLVLPLEVTQGLARYFGTARAEEQRTYVSSAWWFTMTMLAIGCLTAALFAGPLSVWIFGSASFMSVFRWATLLFALTTLFYFLQNQCRWQFMTGAYVVLSVLYSVASLGLAILLGLLMDRHLEGVVIGQVAGTGIAVGVGTALLRQNLFTRVSAALLTRMLRFSLPLVPASLSLFASIYAGRLLLNALASLPEVAVFTFASQIAGVTSLAIIGVQSSLTPYIMTHHADPATPRVVGRFLEAFSVVAVLLCLGLGLLAPPLIAWFAPTTYAGAGPLLFALCPAAILLQMYIFWPGFSVGERTDKQMWISFLGGASTIAFNALLIPRLGIGGAAVANLIAALLFLGVWRAAAERHYPIPVDRDRMLALIAVYVVAALVGSMIGQTEAWAVAARMFAFVVAATCVIWFGPLSITTAWTLVQPYLRGRRRA